MIDKASVESLCAHIGQKTVISDLQFTSDANKTLGCNL